MDSKNEKFRFQYQGGIGIFWRIKRTKELDTSKSNILINYYFTENFSTISIPFKPAKFKNNAGIIGVAMFASKRVK